MKQIKIYDPAMCCSTGVCGVNVDPELMRIAMVLETLSKKGIKVERYNPKDSPQAYVDNEKVSAYLMQHTASALPIILINDEIIMTKEYPSNAQLAEWIGIKEEELIVKS